MSSRDDYYQILTEAEYTGGVLVSLDGCLDEYFPSIEEYKKEVLELLEINVLEKNDLPEYIWGCKNVDLYELSSVEIASISLEKQILHKDGIYSQTGEFEPTSLEALRLALENFYAANSDIKLVVPDWDVQVKLHWGDALNREAIAS